MVFVFGLRIDHHNLMLRRVVRDIIDKDGQKYPVVVKIAEIMGEVIFKNKFIQDNASKI